MTSRTIDIYCNTCRKYLFSLQPDDSKGIAKDYYCDSKCKVVGKLKGDAVVDERKSKKLR